MFGVLVHGQGDAAGAVDALAEAARQGRRMVWSARPAERALPEGTVLDGVLRGSHGGTAEPGLYLNDANDDNMGYHLHGLLPEGRREHAARRLPAGRQATLRLTVPLTGAASADAASRGGYVDDVEVVGAERGVTSQVHDGLSVVGRTMRILRVAPRRFTTPGSRRRRGPMSDSEPHHIRIR